MPNIVDYLNWRGDLSFSSVPLCDADRLVLCRLSYMPFEGVVPGATPGDGVPLPEAMKSVLGAFESGTRAPRLEQDADLARALVGSARFSDVRAVAYRSVFNEQRQEQFSAVTFLLPDGSAYVSFRGTDGTLVGWKEDFNLSFSDSVPAQRDALAYVEEVAAAHRGPFYRRVPLRLGGHSKGGNLAVYAGAFASRRTQRWIAEVRNMDGPGFEKETVARAGFARVIGRVRTYLPQSSVVGMLLEHEEDFTIVHSVRSGLMQHDPYSWEIMRGDFVTVERLTNRSQFIDTTLKDFIAGMDREKRGKLVDGLYALLSASDAVTLRDLWNGRNVLAILKAVKNMDDETRAILVEALRLLRASLKRSLPMFTAKP